MDELAGKLKNAFESRLLRWSSSALTEAGRAGDVKFP